MRPPFRLWYCNRPNAEWVLCPLLVSLHVVLVEGPFPHVAVHVVEAKRVRFLRPDFVCCASLVVLVGRVVLEPCVLIELLRIVAKEVRGLALSAACSVFPLGFG